MATIRQYTLANGKKRWEFFAYAGINRGTGKEKKVHRRSFTSMRKAKDAAKQVEAGIVENKREVNDREQYTIEEFLNYWIDNLKVNAKEGTRIVHRENINTYIIPRIGKYLLSDYSLINHQKFINGLFTEEGLGRSKKGLSWNTVQLINGTLSNAMKKAVQLGFISINPTVGVEFNRNYKPEKRKLRYYTQEQVDDFLETAKDERMNLWYLFFVLMFDCGLRLGEDLALRWSRIDFNNRSVIIDTNRLYRAEIGQNYDKNQIQLRLDDPKTEHSTRKIPLTNRAYVALKEYRMEQGGNVFKLPSKKATNDFIFIATAGRTKGLPISSKGAEEAMKRISKRAGLPHLNVHGSRHSYGVRLRESGVSMDDIQDLMGHADPSTTRIYAEITPKIKEDAVSKLNRYLSGK